MSSLNKKVAQPTVKNEAGLAVKKISPENTLMRMALANMLFEGQFYVDGQTSADVMAEAVRKSDPVFAMSLAKTARKQFKLRHVPLLIVRELIRTGTAKAEDIAEVIQRPDEMGELLALYNKDGKQPLTHQLKKGLGKAFVKFNEYSLAKNDKNSAAYSVRDVMFMVRPKPLNEDQEALFKRIANKEMVVPDTWETQLSNGADKKETFERLMAENKLGALAFIRNLRNMVGAGISESKIREYSANVDVSNVLPFRFIAAARIVPALEDMLENMMFRACEGMEKIKGSTDVVVDVSGSMFGTKVSAKSDLDRFDAAAALAVLTRELCEDVNFYTFSNGLVRVPARRGFALVEALLNSQSHGGTDLGNSLNQLRGKNGDNVRTRTIVITDEQSTSRPSSPQGKGYILNVGSYQNGINHDKWTTITGFSEAVFSYIQEIEKIA